MSFGPRDAAHDAVDPDSAARSAVSSSSMVAASHGLVQIEDRPLLLGTEDRAGDEAVARARNGPVRPAPVNWPESDW
jgi:hypothetical protein